MLLDQKLRKYIPKGKLHPLRPGKPMVEEPLAEQEEEKHLAPEEAEDHRPEPVHELDRLEMQLQDIEEQLKGMGQ